MESVDTPRPIAFFRMGGLHPIQNRTKQNQKTEEGKLLPVLELWVFGLLLPTHSHLDWILHHQHPCKAKILPKLISIVR
jgi:hypothetical protein